LIALRDWSHCTNSASDPARSRKFYQDIFGFRIQAYQGPDSPTLNVGKGSQFLAFGSGGSNRGEAGVAPGRGSINHFCMTMDNFNPEKVIKTLESYLIKPRGSAQGAPGPLVHYISMRMENRGGAKEGTPELLSSAKTKFDLFLKRKSLSRRYRLQFVLVVKPTEYRSRHDNMVFGNAVPLCPKLDFCQAWFWHSRSETGVRTSLVVRN
jgi:hypothetical protein